MMFSEGSMSNQGDQFCQNMTNTNYISDLEDYDESSQSDCPIIDGSKRRKRRPNEECDVNTKSANKRPAAMRNLYQTETEIDMLQVN